MEKKVKLPCGLDKEGNVIYTDEAKNGLGCECLCPGCGQPLVAKNEGKKKQHHFAHYSSCECEHGYQSALHYMAKELFLEMREFTFKKNGNLVKYKIDQVKLETKLGDIIPDIIVICDGRQFIAEIFVTHKIDEAKAQKIRDLKISAMEIDLSGFRSTLIDKSILRQELCNPRRFSFIYDADADLIEAKRAYLVEHGVRQRIVRNGRMRLVTCNIAKYFDKIPLSYCQGCHFSCTQDADKGIVYCGRYCDPNSRNNPKIFVNENRVLFDSEFNRYYCSIPSMFENIYLQCACMREKFPPLHPLSNLPII